MYALAILLEEMWALMKTSYRAIRKLSSQVAYHLKMAWRKGKQAGNRRHIRYRNAVVAELIAYAWRAPKDIERNASEKKEEPCRNEVLAVPLLVWSC